MIQLIKEQVISWEHDNDQNKGYNVFTPTFVGWDYLKMHEQIMNNLYFVFFLLELHAQINIKNQLVNWSMLKSLTTSIPAKALRFFNRSNRVLATKAMSWTEDTKECIYD